MNKNYLTPIKKNHWYIIIACVTLPAITVCANDFITRLHDIRSQSSTTNTPKNTISNNKSNYQRSLHTPVRTLVDEKKKQKEYSKSCSCNCGCKPLDSEARCVTENLKKSACKGCYDCPRSCVCHTISPCKGAPFLQYRSQGSNRAKYLVGWQSFTHLYGKKDTYGTISTSVECTSSFRPTWIAQYLFGSDLVNGNTLIIQGSEVPNRHPKAWLADYFGLPIDFDSTVTFCPHIKNITFDLNTYISIDRVAKGLYLAFQFPIAATSWELNMSECIRNPGVKSFPVGYMDLLSTDTIGAYGKARLPNPGIPIAQTKGEANEMPLPREDLRCSFINAMQIGNTFGDQQESLYFGTMPCKALKKTSLADIHGALGWNFILHPDRTMGASLHVVIPTGNRPDARYLFEPIVGNGRHWEFGFGMNGSWVIHRNADDENRYFGIWFDAVITSLLKTHQARSFDFCGKPNNRYALLVEMMTEDEFSEFQTVPSRIVGAQNFTEIIPLPNGDITTADYVYKAEYDATNDKFFSHLTPVINFSTRITNVQIDLQADIAVKVGYQAEHWGLDIGYNFWARTREKLTPSKDYCKTTPSKAYVLKGDSPLWVVNLFSFLANNDWTVISGSQSKSDIHSGQNMKLKNINLEDAQRNKGVDNPQLTWFARDFENNPSLYSPLYTAAFLNSTDFLKKLAYSSFQPKLVSADDLNTCQSAPAMTHKLFFHFNYKWKEKNKWKPFAGFGGEVEFAPKNKKYRAISQWGAWIKAGVGFN